MNENNLYFFFTRKWEGVCKNVVLGCFGWFSACFVVFFITNTFLFLYLGFIPVLITIFILFIADQSMQYHLLDETSKARIRAKIGDVGITTVWILLVTLVPSFIYLLVLCF